MRRVLQTTGRYAEEAINYITIGLLAFCLLVTFVDITMRAITGVNLLWAQQASTWAMVIFVMLIAGVILREKGHISIDIVPRLLKGTARKIVVAANTIVVIVFSVLALYSAIVYVANLKGLGLTRLLGMLHIPFWTIILLSFVLGMSILLIYGILTLIDSRRSSDDTSKQA